MNPELCGGFAQGRIHFAPSIGITKGQVRSEGKEYVMADGDIVLFRFNV